MKYQLSEVSQQIGEIQSKVNVVKIELEKKIDQKTSLERTNAENQLKSVSGKIGHLVAVNQEKVNNQLLKVSKQMEKIQFNAEKTKKELNEKVKQQAALTKQEVQRQITENSKNIEKINLSGEVVKEELKQKIKHNQEEVQNLLTLMSGKFKEIDNRKEPVIAFRAGGLKYSGSDKQKLDRHAGN